MKILVFLAEGFEEIEALTVVDYIRRLGGISVDMVSISDQLAVTGAHKIKVEADKLIKDVDLKDYSGLVIPGGMPGAKNLRDDTRVISLVQEAMEEGKLLAAICAGPIVLARAGVVKGKNITSFPGFEEELREGNYLEDKLVVDGNIITSRGPALAVEFVLAIVEKLLGREKLEELKESILYHELFK